MLMMTSTDHHHEWGRIIGWNGSTTVETVCISCGITPMMDAYQRMWRELRVVHERLARLEGMLLTLTAQCREQEVEP